ncbi:odorant receptor 131-2-like [Hyla sarda]|uniref:odorant receptor 131-2-like n=1 Tax=Hyla sarda TaxID=327740 RepID=UPI0024C4311B|nr:odorant receptor 131-2-like [Hyla sarda]
MTGPICYPGQFSYNHEDSESSGSSPFFVVYGLYPRPPLPLFTSFGVPMANDQTREAAEPTKRRADEALEIFKWKILQILFSTSYKVMNSSGSFNNGSQTSADRALFIVTNVFIILTFLCFCFFLYFISILLIVYFTTPQVRETSRYVLFAHMLVNDTLYLLLGFFLVLAYKHLYIPVPICYFVIAITTASFRVTPYNLAVMALERYLAICYPLRYSMFCTVKRTYSVITAMWVLGFFPNAADLVVLSTSVKKSFFSQKLICKQEELIVEPVQNTIRSITFIGSLILVALVILFTYVKVMVIAWKSGCSSSSASKAGRTVMLHTIQLLLSIVSLTSNITECYGGNYMVMINFLLFMCFPRLLSPLIYGIRDEVFSKCIKKMYSTVYKDKTLKKF